MKFESNLSNSLEKSYNTMVYSNYFYNEHYNSFHGISTVTWLRSSLCMSKALLADTAFTHVEQEVSLYFLY